MRVLRIADRRRGLARLRSGAEPETDLHLEIGDHELEETGQFIGLGIHDRESPLAKDDLRDHSARRPPGSVPKS